MSEEFNINTVAAEVINQQLTDVRNALPRTVSKLWASQVTSFRKYLLKTQDRASKTKTLLYKDRAVPLTDLYVGTLLDGPTGSPVADNAILDLILNHQHICVMATAGAGKSFFAKSLFLALLNSKKTIPLLLEMRDLNNSEGGIVSRLCSDLSGRGYSLTSNEFEGLIVSGRFSLILDGFDELVLPQYTAASKELLTLLKTCRNKCSIVLLSRPDERVSSIADFDCYRIRALTEHQAVSLIQRLEYDADIKREFITNLQSTLYHQHEDFLSNPLLLTIMLMTYGDTAEIPKKLHIFYEQAFDVLFYKHDASKGVYRREIKSQLPFDDFKSLLATVAASGYVGGKISASRDEILEFIKKGKKVARVPKVNPDLFLEDLLKTVCILIQDGIDLVYNHRSFQEYFAALFLISSASANRKDVYDAYLEKDGLSNALSLAYDINSNLVESEYLLPELQRMLAEIGNCPFKAMSIWGGTVKIGLIRRKEKADKLTFIVGEPSNDFRLMQFVFKKSGRMFIQRRGVDRHEESIIIGKIKNLQSKKQRQYESVNPLNRENHELLTKLGLTYIVDSQIKMCQQFVKSVEKRLKNSVSKTITEWL